MVRSVDFLDVFVVEMSFLSWDLGVDDVVELDGFGLVSLVLFLEEANGGDLVILVWFLGKDEVMMVVGLVSLEWLLGEDEAMVVVGLVSLDWFLVIELEVDFLMTGCCSSSLSSCNSRSPLVLRGNW